MGRFVRENWLWLAFVAIVAVGSAVGTLIVERAASEGPMGRIERLEERVGEIERRLAIRAAQP